MCWCGAPPAASACSACNWSRPPAPTPSRVVSDESKAEYVFNLGAKGVINRKDFKCWGQMPQVNSAEYNDWTKEARRFGKAIWDITGKRDVDIVFEHPGEQTFPVSCLVVKRGGMVVFCAGTTGYNLTFDARYVWMRQKRIQGSHFAHLKQASQANRFVLEQRIDPCMSEVFAWDKIPLAHMKMWKNQHPPGNMAVMVNAPRTGLKTFEDAQEAAARLGAFFARSCDDHRIQFAAVNEDRRADVEKHQRDHRRGEPRIHRHIGEGVIRRDSGRRRRR